MWIFDWRENFTVNFNFLGPVHLNGKCKYEERSSAHELMKEVQHKKNQSGNKIFDANLPII